MHESTFKQKRREKKNTPDGGVHWQARMPVNILTQTKIMVDMMSSSIILNSCAIKLKSNFNLNFTYTVMKNVNTNAIMKNEN